MNANKKTKRILEDMNINVKFKISALWTVLMMFYVYTDFYTLYTPGKIEEMISGVMEGLPVTQMSLLIIAIITVIPAVMIFLSLVLKAKANRWTNIIVAMLHVIIGISGLIGETWLYYIFYSFSIFLITSLIVWYAWKWPNKTDINI